MQHYMWYVDWTWATRWEFLFQFKETSSNFIFNVIFKFSLSTHKCWFLSWFNNCTTFLFLYLFLQCLCFWTDFAIATLELTLDCIVFFCFSTSLFCGGRSSIFFSGSDSVGLAWLVRFYAVVHYKPCASPLADTFVKLTVFVYCRISDKATSVWLNWWFLYLNTFGCLFWQRC